MGAARAVLVSDDALAGSDSLSTAKVLAKAVERAGGIDLVVTATESTDGYTGTIPAQVAELLGWPSLTFAKHVEIGDGKVTIQRQTEAGYDEVEASLPAVVSVTAGVVEPRYPSFKGIMAAKNKPVDQVTVADLGLDADQVGLGRRPPEDRERRRRARARGRREDRGRRRGVPAHRAVPRAAQGRLRSRIGTEEGRRRATDGSFQDLGLRRGRRRQADERDARDPHQGPRARRHRRGGLRRRQRRRPGRRPRRARRDQGVRGRPRRRAPRRRRRGRAGRRSSASTRPTRSCSRRATTAATRSPACR